MTNAAFYKNRATLHHILNHCSVSLEQVGLHGATIASSNTPAKQSPMASILIIALKFYVTSKNLAKANPPPFLLNVLSLTLFRISVYSGRHARNWELTVAFELNIQQAHKRKLDKYTALVSEIKSMGFKCDIIALEIGSRGYIP